jgi:hypothetical protein
MATARLTAAEDTDGPDLPSSLEGDLHAILALFSELDNQTELTAGLGDEVQRANRLLFQAVTELQRYRDWEHDVRRIAGSSPGGGL